MQFARLSFCTQDATMIESERRGLDFAAAENKELVRSLARIAQDLRRTSASIAVRTGQPLPGSRDVSGNLHASKWRELKRERAQWRWMLAFQRTPRGYI
jgi:hypothetical protein